jgi:hypothetical protein
MPSVNKLKRFLFKRGSTVNHSKACYTNSRDRIRCFDRALLKFGLGKNGRCSRSKTNKERARKGKKKPLNIESRGIISSLLKEAKVNN